MSDQAKPGWKTIPKGGLIIKPGNASEYKTGDWRSQRPVRDDSQCINCMMCFIYCPDSAIPAKEGKVGQIDYEHCKGCGVCAKMCPKKCIKMVDEHEFKE